MFKQYYSIAILYATQLYMYTHIYAQCCNIRIVWEKPRKQCHENAIHSGTSSH